MITDCPVETTKLYGITMPVAMRDAVYSIPEPISQVIRDALSMYLGMARAIDNNSIANSLVWEKETQQS